jgi:hypothetical protein
MICSKCGLPIINNDLMLFKDEREPICKDCYVAWCEYAFPRLL